MPIAPKPIPKSGEILDRNKIGLLYKKATNKGQEINVKTANDLLSKAGVIANYCLNIKGLTLNLVE